MSIPHAHLQTMKKTFTKLQKVQNNIVGGVALTKYPLNTSEMPKNDLVHKLKKEKKNNLTIMSKSHVHHKIAGVALTISTHLRCQKQLSSQS